MKSPIEQWPHRLERINDLFGEMTPESLRYTASAASYQSPNPSSYYPLPHPCFSPMIRAAILPDESASGIPPPG
jgi:hypothetical protein